MYNESRDDANIEVLLTQHGLKEFKNVKVSLTKIQNSPYYSVMRQATSGHTEITWQKNLNQTDCSRIIKKLHRIS